MNRTVRWPLKRIICVALISPLAVIAAPSLIILMAIGMVISGARWVLLTAEGEENIDFWGW